MKISEVSVGLEVESEMESRRTRNSSTEIGVERVLVAPTVGLSLQGSAYHPNLLLLEADTQTGYGWQNLAITGPSGSSFTGSREEERLLQRYDGRATWLREKPYATTFFVNRGRDFRDIDFFDRVTVDSQGYGVTTGYREAPVPVNITAHRLEQTESGLLRNLTSDETAVSASANHRRAQGHTTFLYNLNQFTRNERLVPAQDGLNHSINLIDSESLGPGDRLSLNTSLFYNHLKNSSQRGQGFTAQEQATLRHTRDLQSQYHYSFDDRTSGAVESAVQQGRASLRHQLYDSLTSIAEADVQSSDLRGPGTSLQILRPGGGLSESYTKRLGSWGRLSLSDGIRFSHEQRESAGRFQQILNEQHTLTDGVVTFLSQPRVVSDSVRVSDASGIRTYAETLDYTLVEQGALTEIRRVPGGAIPNGATIVVEYRAAASPTTSFVTLANRAQIRLDFWQTVGVYAQLNLIEHRGGDNSVQLQEVVDQVAGVDVTWRWLRAGAEYEVFDSNLAPFESARLFETFTFQPTRDSSLSFDFGQGRQYFPDSGVARTSYHFIGRFKWRISTALNLEMDGGMRITRGRGLNQQTSTARPGLEYAYGKLSASASYEFRDETYLGEKRQRHSAYLRLKRRF